jgi:hypothetical protein
MITISIMRLKHVEALKLSELPERLLLIGGGYISMEMAQHTLDGRDIWQRRRRFICRSFRLEQRRVA